MLCSVSSVETVLFTVDFLNDVIMNVPRIWIVFCFKGKRTLSWGFWIISGTILGLYICLTEIVHRKFQNEKGVEKQVSNV